MTITKEQVEKILLHQVKGHGESIWEQFERKFDGKQEEYLKFLVDNKYITQKQADDWMRVYKEVYNLYDDCCEYANIEAMTYITPAQFPYDVYEFYEIEENEDDSIDLQNAKDLDLINVPIVIKTQDVEEYNEIYWTQVVPIIAHYVSENYEYYKETLDEILN